MKLARHVLVIAVAFLMPACQDKVNEVTAPLAPPQAAEWGRARTRTPTPTPTPTPLDLTGRWIGTFTYQNCFEPIGAQLVQTGSEVYGYFSETCFDPWDVPQVAELTGTLQGSSLTLALWLGDLLITNLDGPATSTTIDVWNETQSTGLSLTRSSPWPIGRSRE